MKKMRCPDCIAKKTPKISKLNRQSSIQKYGSYRRKSDSRIIQRFLCKSCQSTFSNAINDPAYYHKKRRVNYILKGLLASSVSLRRSAKLLGISRTTVARKLIFLGKLCREEQANFLKHASQNVDKIQFDELQTIEHSKCKPLSVATVVSVSDRKILGVGVATMPATGYLAKIARKKYGKRKDQRQEVLMGLFKKLSKTLSKNLIIYSDKHPYYRLIITRYFPTGIYHQIKGIQATVSGQGELKKNAKDPLFCINHTLAMFRANINRLIRKTWCTTKDPARLADHLAIYISIHNSLLTA